MEVDCYRKKDCFWNSENCISKFMPDELKRKLSNQYIFLVSLHLCYWNIDSDTLTKMDGNVKTVMKDYRSYMCIWGKWWQLCCLVDLGRAYCENGKLLEEEETITWQMKKDWRLRSVSSDTLYNNWMKEMQKIMNRLIFMGIVWANMMIMILIVTS